MKYLADIAFLVGAAAMLVGLWWVYPPIALIVGGGTAASWAVVDYWRRK